MLNMYSLFALAGGTTVGFNMSASKMDMPPVQTVSSDEQSFKKNTVGFFTNSSFFRDVLFLNTNMELIRLQKDSLTVNGTVFPQLENQGVRSFETNGMLYLYTLFGWRNHLNLGYNTKGYEKNNDIQFALVKGETYGGVTLIRRPKPKYDINYLFRDMQGILERKELKITANYYIGDHYTANEVLYSYTLPIRRNINFHTMYKVKNYKHEDISPRKFLNEQKLIGGLIFKGQNQHHYAMSFNVYHDFNLKEMGTSLGIMYYFAHKENAITRSYANMREKYKEKNHDNPDYKKSKKHSKNHGSASNDDVREAVIDILEEVGIL